MKGRTSIAPVGLALTIAIVTAAAGFGLSSAAGANWFIHWNSAGANSYSDAARGAQIHEYRNYIGVVSPLFVAGTELCYEQFLEIRSATGYHGRWTESYRNPNQHGGLFCGGPSRRIYGNAILGNGALTKVDSMALVLPSQSSTSQESWSSRRIVCLKVAYIFSDSSACSTHLTSWTVDQPANGAQLAEASFSTISFSNGSDRTYLLGDLNARSYMSIFDGLYSGGFRESEPRSSKRSTFNGGGGAISCGQSGVNGIDFIFGNMSANPQGPLPYLVAPNGLSDHCMIVKAFA